MWVESVLMTNILDLPIHQEQVQPVGVCPLKLDKIIDTKPMTGPSDPSRRQLKQSRRPPPSMRGIRKEGARSISKVSHHHVPGEMK